MTEYSYQVLYKPEGVNTDITDYVDRIDAVEVGSGEVRNCKIRLNAMDGWFITNASSGATPLIDQFDKIRVIITDRDSATYDVVYEVDNLKPIQNSQVGLLLEVEMLGMEWHLQKIQFAKPFFQESGFEVARDIINYYNDPDASGTLDTIVEGQSAVFGVNDYGNELPQFTANVYPFNIREQSCYSALDTTVDRMSGTVPAGGAGDFFEFGFQDKGTPWDTVQFRGFISGSPPDQVSVPTIDDSLSVNPGEEEGGLLSTQGYVRGTWGGDAIGTMPYQNGLFQGGLEIWNQYPEHIPGLTYPIGAIVEIRTTTDAQGDFSHYKANAITSATPPHADWDVHLFTDFLTDEVEVAGQYSRFTNARADEWKSCGAKVDGSVGNDPPLATSVHVWDHNLVVTDGSYSRTWVDATGTSPASIPTQLLDNGTDFRRGFRVLVNGTGSGAYAGFDNKIIQYNSPTTFVVFRDPANDAMVADDDEAKVYQKQSGLWVDISATREGNDCYHPVYGIGNDQGLNNKNNGAGGNFGEVSAVTYEFIFGNGQDNTDLSSPTYYRQGAWINWRVPFPSNSYNSNIIGELYGNQTTHEPATLDSGNMHFTSNGKIGFNNAQAMDLGPFDAITFGTKFLWTYNADGSGSAVRAGNFECRCVMYDSSDNVVIQDFIIPFNGDYTQTVNLPIKEFKIYRGRKPWSFGDLASNVFLQDLEILNVFEWKNIVKIGWVWLGPYDDEGRYQPYAQQSIMIPSLEDFFSPLVGITHYNLKWSIDAFQFTKPGLVVSDPVPTGRALMLPFDDQPQIDNLFSLKQHNQGKLELDKFRQVRYEVVTEGTCDLRFGDSVFLENDEMVRETDDGGTPNTVKLVCKRIRYEITKPPTGPGGFLRYIDGVRRFV